jgi:GDPmannose 4,6-dehydratase
MVFYLIMKVLLRGETFVTRKITRAVSKIALGFKEKYYILEILDAQTRLGTCKRLCLNGMWLMMQQADKPEDFVNGYWKNH